MSVLLVRGRGSFVEVLAEDDTDFGDLIATNDVLDELDVAADLDHLEGTAQDAAEDIAVEEGVAAGREVDELCEGVFVKDQGELFVVGRPVGHIRCHSEEHLEADLGDHFSGFLEVSTSPLA